MVGYGVPLLSHPLVQTIDAVEDPDMQQEVDLMKKLVDTRS